MDLTVDRKLHKRHKLCYTKEIDMFELTMAPNMVNIVRKTILDAKYELVARHGDLLSHMFALFRKSWVGGHSAIP